MGSIYTPTVNTSFCAPEPALGMKRGASCTWRPGNIPESVAVAVSVHPFQRCWQYLWTVNVVVDRHDYFSLLYELNILYQEKRVLLGFRVGEGFQRTDA